MLPIPFSEHIPGHMQRRLSEDSAGTAMVVKADDHLEEWRDEILEMAFFKIATRCPAGILVELGAYLAAGLRDYDSEAVKREKIFYAIRNHKRRGSWERDAKLRIDAIVGGDSDIYSATDSADWILLANDPTDPTYYWATMGEDGADSDLGIDLIGAGDECAIAGNVCIDLDDGINISVGPTQFQSNTVGIIGVTKLINGNFVILYLDTTANQLKFNIRQNDGTDVTTVTVSGGVNTSYAALTALADGGFAVTYRDPGGPDGQLVLYNADGTESVAAQQFESNDVENIAMLEVVEGILIVYVDDTLNDGKMTIRDASTGAVTGYSATFTTDTVDDLDVTLLADDNWVIIFNRFSGTHRVDFTIYAGQCVQQIIPTQIEAVDADSFASISVERFEGTDSQWGVAYRDVTNNRLRYVTYDYSTQIAAPTNVGTEEPEYLDLVALDNGDHILLWSLYDGTGRTRMVLLDRYGQQGVDVQIISEENINNPVHGVSLGNGTFLYAHKDSAGGGSDGLFTIYTDGAGYDEVRAVYEDLVDDIVPAYMKVFLGYENDIGQFIKYLQGTMQ